MASSIKIKRSETSGNPSVLGAGELAYSALADNGNNGGDRLYIGSGVETGGNAVNHLVIGGKYFTDMINAASASNTALTLVKRDASGNIAVNDITVNGVLYSNDITSSSISVTGDATITGNLIVQGTTTTINSTTLSVTDLNITLGKDAANATAANGAGLTVGGSGAALTYTSTDDRWNFNKDLNVGTVYGNLSGSATSANAWSNARSLSLTGDAAATLTSVDGSANVSATLTLATVNANTGSFGSGTSVPNFTVNAKGLITAAGATAIPTASTTVLGLASFDANQFSVSSGAATIKTLDGGTY